MSAAAALQGKHQSASTPGSLADVVAVYSVGLLTAAAATAVAAVGTTASTGAAWADLHSLPGPMQSLYTAVPRDLHRHSHLQVPEEGSHAAGGSAGNQIEPGGHTEWVFSQLHSFAGFSRNGTPTCPNHAQVPVEGNHAAGGGADHIQAPDPVS